MKYTLFPIILLLLSVAGCKSSPTEVINTNDDYMSLNVGDIRQCYMPYSANDTIYTVWKITGKTFRSDSTEVFTSEWYTYNYDPRNRYFEYYFIRDGFLYSTQLEKTSTLLGNPYDEQKLAEVKPHEGDTWLQTVGYINPDSTQDYFTAKHLDEFDTPAGKFKDVYCFIGNNGSPNTEQGKTFYAKYFGYLGISFTDSLSQLFVVNYMKINGKEIGKYVQMAAIPSKVYNLISKKSKNFISPTGAKLR